jgi:hypothetical protein
LREVHQEDADVRALLGREATGDASVVFEKLPLELVPAKLADHIPVGATRQTGERRRPLSRPYGPAHGHRRA